VERILDDHPFCGVAWVRISLKTIRNWESPGDANLFPLGH